MEHVSEMTRDDTTTDLLNDRSDYQQCYVCGQRNTRGLRVVYRQAGELIETDFTPMEEHQGYPGFCHGGVLTALLDETAGRAAMLERKWVMTMKLETRFRRPVRIRQRLTIQGWPVRWRGRILEAKAQVLLPDGTVAIDAAGLFVRMPKDVGEEAAQNLPSFRDFWRTTDAGA